MIQHLQFSHLKYHTIFSRLYAGMTLRILSWASQTLLNVKLPLSATTYRMTAARRPQCCSFRTDHTGRLVT